MPIGHVADARTGVRTDDGTIRTTRRAKLVESEAALGTAASHVADQRVSDRLSWLTPRRVLLGTLAWVGTFALGSMALANPFFAEKTADSPIKYWNIMYLHGLLIGMVGIALLLGMLVFDIQWPHARLLVAGGVILATLLDTIGGVFDRSASTTSAPMWTQVAGFFVLDEMLVAVIIAFGIDWFAHTAPSRQLSFVVGWLASVSMFIAAIMGHIAGWILDFGAHPWFVASYAKFVGEKASDLQANMVGSHSHDMGRRVHVLRGRKRYRLLRRACTGCSGCRDATDRPDDGRGEPRDLHGGLRGCRVHPLGDPHLVPERARHERGGIR